MVIYYTVFWKFRLISNEIYAFFIKGFLLTSHIFTFGYPMTCSIASWPKLTALNAAMAAVLGDTEACIEPKNIIVSNYC